MDDDESPVWEAYLDDPTNYVRYEWADSDSE